MRTFANKALSFCLIALSLSSMAFADDSLSSLGDVTLPCAASALNAASDQAKAKGNASQGEQYSFYSFGPQSLTQADEKNGGNEAYWVGFQSNVSGRPLLNYRVAVYCQQGGFKNVVSITQQP